MIDVRALGLILAVAVLTAAAPSAADARAHWSGTIALPRVPAYAFPLPGAIDDRGRAPVVGYPTSAGARVVRLGPRAPRRPVAVPGASAPTALSPLADGSTVGVAVADGPGLPGVPPPFPDCCEAPAVFRWPAGGGTVATQEAPISLDGGNWGAYDSAVAPDGTVTLLPSFNDALTSDDPVLAAVATARPGDPAIALVREPFRVSQSSSTPVRALSGGRSVIAWRGDRETHVLTLLDGTPVGERSFAARLSDDEQVELDGRGRIVRVGAERGRLWLWAEGRGGRRLISRSYAYPDTYMLAAGPHGSAAVAFTDRGRVRLVTFDARGRRHGPVTLGRKAAAEDLPLVRIDARGGVHVAWPAPHGGVAVFGPGGATHRLASPRHVEVVDLAVSPSGRRELVLWEAGPRAYAAFSSP